MGTGKSSVSRLLAERLGYMRTDLDEEIERREGRSIASIFAGSGEPAFRELETRVLSELLTNRKQQIIATGGGAVLSERNRELMQEYGWVVGLKADAEQIIARVRTDSSRPLLHGDLQERVTRLLEERKHAYDFADLIIDTSQFSTDEVASQIIARWHG